MPCDPLLLGLTYKLDRKVAGKCVNSTSLYQKYPRYVSTKPAFHLLGTYLHNGRHERAELFRRRQYDDLISFSFELYGFQIRLFI